MKYRVLLGGNDMSGFLIGIVASIAAYIIIRIIILCYTSFISRLVSKDVISGSWISTYQGEDGKEYTERIRIRQLGRSIRGSATLSEADKSVEIQKIRGAYKNQILTAEYWSTEKGIIERGTFTLRRTRPNRMEGFYIFFSGDTWELCQSKYVWERPKSV